MLFADLRVLISDEAAIKQSLCNKGASGLIFCIHCQNAVDSLKCSASEALNFLQVLRTYLVLWVLPQCNEDIRNACEVWLAMCKVLDALQKIAVGDGCTAVELQALVKGHLDLAKARYAEDSFWVPKCHLALHLPLQLAKHSCLMGKKISNQVLDTSRAFEKSILDDVLHGHVQQLADPAFLPGEACLHACIYLFCNI